MKIKPIKTNKEYQTYLDWVDKMFDKKVSKNSEEGENLEVILMLIKAYEDKRYPIPVPDPIEAIKVKMEEMNLKSKDLVGLIGSKGHVSAVLNKKKPLTIQLAKIFYKELGIPAEVLLS
jgi:HTH-type transcriptional regulator/antitoxin HigA